MIPVLPGRGLVKILELIEQKLPFLSHFYPPSTPEIFFLFCQPSTIFMDKGKKKFKKGLEAP